MKRGIRGHDVGGGGLCDVCLKCEENKIGYLQLVLEKSVEGFAFGNFSNEYAADLKSRLKDMKGCLLKNCMPKSVD